MIEKLGLGLWVSGLELRGFEERARRMIAIAEETLAPLHLPEKPGFEVAGTDDEGHGKEEKATDAGAEFILALNKADPAKGEQDVGLCKVCHSFEKGGPTMIGPNLYGVVIIAAVVVATTFVSDARSNSVESVTAGAAREHHPLQQEVGGGCPRLPGEHDPVGALAAAGGEDRPH